MQNKLGGERPTSGQTLAKPRIIRITGREKTLHKFPNREKIQIDFRPVLYNKQSVSTEQVPFKIQLNSHMFKA